MRTIRTLAVMALVGATCDGTILARGCGDPDDESWAAIAASLMVG